MVREDIVKSLGSGEVAGLLGVSLKSVRRWARAGKLTHVRTRKSFLFRQGDVQTFIDKYRIKGRERRTRGGENNA